MHAAADMTTIAILVNAGWTMTGNTLSHPDCTVRLACRPGCFRTNPTQWMALTGAWEAERSICGVHSTLRSLIITASDAIEVIIPERVAMA
jgi:hypothetical protein